jgi:hypothetical protein
MCAPPPCWLPPAQAYYLSRGSCANALTIASTTGTAYFHWVFIYSGNVYFTSANGVAVAYGPGGVGTTPNVAGSTLTYILSGLSVVGATFLNSSALFMATDTASVGCLFRAMQSGAGVWGAQVSLGCPSGETALYGVVADTRTVPYRIWATTNPNGANTGNKLASYTVTTGVWAVLGTALGNKQQWRGLALPPPNACTPTPVPSPTGCPSLSPTSTATSTSSFTSTQSSTSSRTGTSTSSGSSTPTPTATGTASSTSTTTPTSSASAPLSGVRA